MIDGTWRSLSDIREALGYPEASISAQLRHLKKGKFGGIAWRKEEVRIKKVCLNIKLAYRSIDVQM